MPMLDNWALVRSALARSALMNSAQERKDLVNWALVSCALASWATWVLHGFYAGQNSAAQQNLFCQRLAELAEHYCHYKSFE